MLLNDGSLNMQILNAIHICDVYGNLCKCFDIKSFHANYKPSIFGSQQVG